MFSVSPHVPATTTYQQNEWRELFFFFFSPTSVIKIFEVFGYRLERENLESKIWTQIIH